MRLPAEVVSRLRPRYEGRRVCVTGGAGFIGGHLCDALCSLGANVAVIDDLSNSDTRHLSELIDMDPERIRFVHGSILEDSALRDAMENAALVFHLAAAGSVQKSIVEPERAFRVNATGTLRVLEQARRERSGRVVLAASSSAYGDGARLPACEDHPPRPISPYAASKVAAEQLMTAWSHAFGLSTVSLRFFNVFGVRQSADSAYAAVVPAFLKSALDGEPLRVYGDGSQTRDFTYVDNAVYAMLLGASGERRFAGEVCNVGVGKRVSVAELARLVVELTGSRSEIKNLAARSGDVLHSLADLRRATDLLGYEPIETFEGGLKRMVEAAQLSAET